MEFSRKFRIFIVSVDIIVKDIFASEMAVKMNWICGNGLEKTTII